MPVKWEIRISLVWILLILAITAILILRPFSCDSRPSGFNWTSIHTWLDSHQYTQAEPVSTPILPDSAPIPDEAVIATTTGSGSWIPTDPIAAGDTVAVELSEITLADGSHWIKLMIDSVEVKWHRIQHYQAPAPERKWQAHVEVCNCEQSLIGVGVGYRIWRPLGVNLSPSVTVSSSADWIAPELRLSRNVWSGVAVGGGAGYRFGRDRGLHLSAGISLEL